MRSLSQPGRLAVAAAYLLTFYVLSLGINGPWYPPLSLEGLWFYAAGASFLLGEYLLEPYFTRPADALANGVTLILGASSVGIAGADISVDAMTRGKTALVVYGGVVVMSAALAIAFKDHASWAKTLVSRPGYLIAGTLGRARVVFAIAFAAAAYAAFADDGQRLTALLLAWFGITSARPFERVATAIASHRDAAPRMTGVVIAIEDPGVAVAQFPESSLPQLGRGATVDGHRGVVVDFTSIHQQPQVRVAVNSNARVRVGRDAALSSDEEPEEPDIIGHVGRGTTLETLSVWTTTLSRRPDLVEGHLISAPIGDETVLFQVTRVELVTVRDSEVDRDIARIDARKLGVWEDANSSFMPVQWVPDAGRPVKLLAHRDEPIFVRDHIGHVPGTTYGVRLNLDYLVTHNAAILGILGIGKTHLAWEMMKRLLASQKRVVALDITGRYAPAFDGIFGPDNQRDVENRITDAISADVDNRAVREDEAGNVREFDTALRRELAAFMGSDSRLLILNPNRFEVSRMEGRPFKEEANMLVRLTMVEVTRMIAEALLEIAVEEAGDEDRAEQAHLCLVLEEAHSLVPEWNSATSDSEKWAVNGTARAILQGRKYGFGCIIVTQRTANVTKSILNQCNTVFGLRAYDATGMGFLENYIGSTYAPLLASLKDRHAVVFGRASSCAAPLVVELNDATLFDEGFWDDERQSVPATAYDVSDDDALVDDEFRQDDDGYGEDHIPF